VSKLPTQRIAIALATAWLSLPALGAAEAGHEPETFLGLPKWIWLWANLLLFIAVLGKFVGPPIKGFLEARSKEIAANLEQARNQRVEAEGMKASLESQIAELKGEMDSLLERAEAEGERDREKILEQAREERERLLAQTDEEIRLRMELARSELTRYTAGLAAQLARQQIQNEIGAEDKARLFDESLQKLTETSE
jgi:F-type H+-transporting ATPase subunit b